MLYSGLDIIVLDMLRFGAATEEEEEEYSRLDRGRWTVNKNFSMFLWDLGNKRVTMRAVLHN
jgi:hypothetical protein